MSSSFCPLIVSMIWPGLSLPVASAGDPFSMLSSFITKAGCTSSMPMPTGPNRLMNWEDAVSFGAVENSGGCL